MARLTDAQLQPDLLYFVVLGPGDGESTLIRIPPDTWIIVDSFLRPRSSTGIVPALEFLDRIGGRLAGAVLTHPHQDHAEGFEIVAARAEEWVACADFWEAPRAGTPAPDQGARWGGSPARMTENPAKDWFNGLVAQAVSGIRTQWEKEPKRRFNLQARQVREVHDARVSVLHPQQPVVARPASWNDESSPLVIDWRGLRILLGADLPVPYWPAASQAYTSAPLAEHSAFKVPHHAAKNAMASEIFGRGGNPSRIWIATPFRRAPHPPRFDDNHGVHLALQCVSSLHLTSVLFPLAATNDPIRRGDLLGHANTASRWNNPPGTTSVPVCDPKDHEEAWVAVGFDESGRQVDLQRGAAAVVVID